MPIIAEVPHRRYNPLTGEWVLCSPQRTKRPWLGQEDPPEAARPVPYDPACYLCPGNRRAGGDRNPDYGSTFVFDNDFPALLPGTEPWETDEKGLLAARTERGVCRVICFSPRHDLSLPLMSAPGIRAVIDTWAAQVEELGAMDFIRYVQIFENRGTMMGCSNPHPHCQVWATEHVPTLPGKKLANQLSYWQSHGSDLLGDYLRLELDRDERIILHDEDWVVLVPFWAVWPYETMLIPRRPVPDLPSLTPAERDSLAVMLKNLTTRYDNLFHTPFPYSMGWHARPTDGAAHTYTRLHAVFYPPLLRSAKVRKFLVGYEMTAEPQRDITPEQAAARLREMRDVHYAEAPGGYTSKEG
ncbi:MAG: UDP-glucose--hexose-1-phosphate uridylyltransferase [Patescibacteria group bacterium]